MQLLNILRILKLQENNCMATNGTIIQAMITISALFGGYSLIEQSLITHVLENIL